MATSLALEYCVGLVRPVQLENNVSFKQSSFARSFIASTALSSLP